MDRVQTPRAMQVPGAAMRWEVWGPVGPRSAKEHAECSGVCQEGHPVDWYPTEDRPVDGYPTEDRPVDGYPKEDRPVDGHPKEGRPMDGHPKEGRR